MFDVAEYSSASDCSFVDINPTSRRKKGKNKPRFSEEQVRSLEVTFESETKLEPRRKAQLAKELGLRPRQVAIWFQNKRARWKSKQAEKDYAVLLASYNNLASQFQSLKEEKQSLLAQLQNLKEEMGKSENRNICTSHESGSDCNKGMENICSKQLVAMLPNDDDISINMALHSEENKEELLKLVVESPLTSSNDWGSSLDSDYHQWWDFWS